MYPNTIYVISAPNEPDFYIGKTTVPLSQRWSNHKSAARKGQGTGTKIMKWLFVHIDTATIEVLEQFSNFKTMDRREAELVWLCKPSLNTNVHFYTYRSLVEINGKIFSTFILNDGLSIKQKRKKIIKETHQNKQ